MSLTDAVGCTEKEERGNPDFRVSCLIEMVLIAMGRGTLTITHTHTHLGETTVFDPQTCKHLRKIAEP